MKPSQEQRIEHIVSRMQTDLSTDAPADALKYVKGLFRTRVPEPRASLVRRVLAVMSVDLAPNRAAFGERSGTGGTARQVLFESGDNAVDLRITAAGAGFEIRGQILGDGFENGHVTIAGNLKTIDTEINAAGEFKLPELPSGDYSITVRGTDAEIFIEQISLR